MSKKSKRVESIKHKAESRTNIPTAEYRSVMDTGERDPVRVAYQRRNRDLDPQLVWRGKDEQDSSDLVVQAPPLYIQEKVHPKALIDDLARHSEAIGDRHEEQFDLFADFNGLPDDNARTEFYQHDAHWSNRMILGDSLQVMGSLAEREGLRGKVQCIYIDPPYGIKFNSNFQWSTTSRDVKDGKAEHITREPEQVKAFRDTWRDGIHTYLSYLRDRLTVARDLLADSGSLFLQIGDENIHRLKSLMDEVFGEQNSISIITVRKTTSEGSRLLGATCDFVLWYARDINNVKSRPIYLRRTELAEDRYSLTRFDQQPYRLDNITSSRPAGEGDVRSFRWFGRIFTPGKGTFKTTEVGLRRLAKAGRFDVTRHDKLQYCRLSTDFGYAPLSNLWSDISGAVQSRIDPKVYVVQTSTTILERCILLATDPGDLVLDPTCGSGTTAYVAEQRGRRWITIDTSRVSMALARARIMGARYPYYLLADSPTGQKKEAELSRTAPSSQPTHGDIRHGFVSERVPHITLKSIANNAEIDVIYEKYQEELEPLRERLNAALAESWDEWEIPREADESWPQEAQSAHEQWWAKRIARQKEIDASIAAHADQEYLYDRPYTDPKTVRVAGPFTVESISPHRSLGVDENDELIEESAEATPEFGGTRDFVSIILENLRAAGVQQAHKEDRIVFSSLTPWPGDLICAEGRYTEGEAESGVEKRAGVFIGPEFGTVQREDLAAAAREAAEAGFDVLIACAFNFDAHSSEFNKLGRIPVLKARMNADLHMADSLKSTGKGNLFVIFGEPDIDVLPEDGDETIVPGAGDAGAALAGTDGQVPERIRVRVNGVDVFHPGSGEVRSDGPEGIACWFIDTDYNEESFFVRHAYFLGANDPYKALKTTLKEEINEEAWESLHSNVSRPFEKPASGRIAVKVINHLGDEVMKVFRVG